MYYSDVTWVLQQVKSSETHQESTDNRGFPAHRASNAKNIIMLWRYYILGISDYDNVACYGLCLLRTQSAIWIHFSA